MQRLRWPASRSTARRCIGCARDRVVHLLKPVRHDGRVLTQTAVAGKTNEITAAPGLLASQSLHGRVVTVDALLTQRALACQIQRQGGHYLMAGKDNQPTVLHAIGTLFSEPPGLPAARTQ